MLNRISVLHKYFTVVVRKVYIVKPHHHQAPKTKNNETATRHGTERHVAYWASLSKKYSTVDRQEDTYALFITSHHVTSCHVGSGDRGADAVLLYAGTMRIRNLLHSPRSFLWVCGLACLLVAVDIVVDPWLVGGLVG